MSDTKISEDATPAWPWATDAAPEPEPESAPEPGLVDEGAQEPPDRPNAEQGAAEPRPKRSARLWIVAVVAALIGASVSGGIVGASRGTKTKVVNGATPVAASTSASPSNSSSAPPVVTGSQVRDVLAKVEPAVVTITTNGGAGTGMIITSDGEILTNAHVVGRSSTVKVTLFKETSSRTADVIGVGNASTGPDVALVKIRNASNLPTVTLGDSDKINVGDDVIAIGNALDLAGSPTVTKGIVSATDRSLPDAGTTDTYVQTDAAINPGNSGGPLVTGDGSVIGMNTLVIQQAGANEAAQNLGFAIAVNEIKPLISNLEKGGSLTAGNGAFLGVASETVTSDMADQLGLGTDTGALIDEATADQPAASAGLQRGDVIVGLGGKAVTSSAQLRTLILEKKPGDQVTVDYYRGKDKHTVTVTLGQRPANP